MSRQQILKMTYDTTNVFFYIYRRLHQVGIEGGGMENNKLRHSTTLSWEIISEEVKMKKESCRTTHTKTY